jgi:hypothetical protein
MIRQLPPALAAAAGRGCSTFTGIRVRRALSMNAVLTSTSPQ